MPSAMRTQNAQRRTLNAEVENMKRPTSELRSVGKVRATDEQTLVPPGSYLNVER